MGLGHSGYHHSLYPERWQTLKYEKRKSTIITIRWNDILTM